MGFFDRLNPNSFDNLCRAIMYRVRRDDMMNDDMLCGMILMSLRKIDDGEKKLKNNNMIRFEYYCFICHCIFSYLHTKRFKTQIIQDTIQDLDKCLSVFENVLKKYPIRDIFVSRFKEYAECAAKERDIMALFNSNILFSLSTRKIRLQENVNTLSFSMDTSLLTMTHTSIFFTTMIPAYCESVEKYLRIKNT